MTSVLIKRGHLKTDLYRVRIPCKQEDSWKQARQISASQGSEGINPADTLIQTEASGTVRQYISGLSHSICGALLQQPWQSKILDHTVALAIYLVPGV